MQEESFTDIYLGLGSNMGNRMQLMEAAILLCHKFIGIFETNAPFITTQPWGFSSENMFLNTVIKLKTKHPPLVCLDMCMAIERELGRQRTGDPGYHDRPIDIDILQYGDTVMDTPRLKIPHPLMLQREFVLQPMAAIAPNVVHPVAQKTYRELFAEWKRAQNGNKTDNTTN